MNSSSHTRFDELTALLSEVDDLEKAESVLDWDQETMMPPRGGSVRAEQLATLARTAHEKFTSPDTLRLIDDLRLYEESMPFDSFEASLIRVARRNYEKQSHVPSSLKSEMARAAAVAREAWVEARRNSDFQAFLPHLRKNVELKRRYVECFAPSQDPYDILLDDYEPGMKTSEVQRVFEDLKTELVPLIKAIGSRPGASDDPILHGHFPVDRQQEFCLNVISRFGFDPESWRLDTTVHPFTTNFATQDIRITTRFHEDFISAALFGAMHECGHGLYENGVDPALERTMLCRGASLAWHESQSRLWENLVGRSRPFWIHFYPQLQSTFPEHFGRVPLETFYRSVNLVTPSLIRVEADEATYGLHIIVRFELELDMVHARLPLKDLPEAWNAKMKEYLGVVVPDDSQGVLQDIHWAHGSLGYFPTYSLGNILASQLWKRLSEDVPDLGTQVEVGEFGALREWLREHVYRHGAKFTPDELRERVLGTALDPTDYVQYLKAKYAPLYGLRSNHAART